MEKKQWYKDKVFYQIWPRSFKDGNGDGMGDLLGGYEVRVYLWENKEKARCESCNAPYVILLFLQAIQVPALCAEIPDGSRNSYCISN